MLARLLTLPLRKFERYVGKAEASAEFAALRSMMMVEQLAGTLTAPQAVPGLLPQPATLLGEVSLCPDLQLKFQYRHEYLAREYRFDEEAVTRLRATADFPSKLASCIRQLHLINTRNRLTHALIGQTIAAQAAYLRSGEVLQLQPVTQAALAAALRDQPGLAVVADAGRVSRLVRGLSLGLPNGTVAPLSQLLAKPRQVHQHYVDHVVKREQEWLLEGLLPTPLTDEGIAAMLDSEFGLQVSRRTVANIRRDLAIPDCRLRTERMKYLSATEGFSALLPLTAPTLRVSMPAHSGVYEIRTSFPVRQSQGRDGWVRKQDEHGRNSVLYIGSAVNLRKRLSDHLRGNTDNAELHSCIAGGTARVRYRLINDDWRRVERDLYLVFCDTFGAPPACNRMSP